MLGSIADAEDMVQETFLSWMNSDKSHVENPKFYLIRAITNKCISHLRKLKQERETYTGVWLPEPVVSNTSSAITETEKELNIGFLYLLERLTPIERAVLILKESFNFQYSELSSIFDVTEESCRQHLSRGRKKLQQAKNRFKTDAKEYDRILRVFMNACISGNLEELVSLLREDVTLYSDGGGKVSTFLNPIEGREKVSNLLIAGMKKVGSLSKIEFKKTNGLTSAIIYIEGYKPIPDALIALAIDEQRKISNLFFIVNPEKLQYINLKK
jgi:RNA polymerase sigma-70 factor (ECF subfamily)